MKAFFYTLVLAAVLVGAVVFLMSIDSGPQIAREETEEPIVDAAGQPHPSGDRALPKFTSDAATLSQLGGDFLDDTNKVALHGTGDEMLNLWHLPEATEVFERLVAEDSTDIRALLKVVECYSHPMVGREKDAMTCWLRARNSPLPALADSLLVRAVGNIFVQGFPVGGLNKIVRVEEVQGRSVETGLYLAFGLLEADRPAEAESVLEELLDGDESLGRVRELLIRAQAALGKMDEAENAARELAALYPEEPFPYVMLSRVLLLRGNIDSAVEFANTALTLDGRFVPAIITRAHLYVAAGELEAARVSFEKILLFDDDMLSSLAMEGVGHVDFIAGRFSVGADAMDESIRLAMSAGSTRRGLLYAFRLVDYLCELGRPDAAIGVLQRWVSKRGAIPEQLGAVRVSISAGEHTNARHALGEIKENPKYRTWMRALFLDFPDTEALAFIQARQFSQALSVLNAATAPSPVGNRRSYLLGYANFESGDAEAAADYFDQACLQLHTLEFPYHGDPILYVESIFFQAETAIARSEVEVARNRYEKFLSLWGEAVWDLQAVGLARDKLTRLTPVLPEG